MNRTRRQRAGDVAFFAGAYVLLAGALAVDVLLALVDLPARLRAVRVCHCGHESELHRRLRPGTDCALCECQRLRRCGR